MYDIRSYYGSYVPVPEMDPKAIAEAAAIINSAKKPWALVGQGVELGEAQNELVERNNFV